MTSVLIAIGVGIVLGIVTGIAFVWINRRVNTIQRKLNKIENKLAAAGATWLAELLEDAIVGDARSIELRVRAFLEAEDSTQFFLDNITFPLTIYTIKETARYYPALFAKIVEEISANDPTLRKNSKNRSSSN